MNVFYPEPEETRREQKLPGWAQDLITTLRRGANVGARDVSTLRERLDIAEARLVERAADDTGAEDSTAWLWRETASGEELPPYGLGKDAQVDFRPADGIEMTVECRDNGIIVSGVLHLMVIPIERGRIHIQPVSAKIKN